METNQISVEFSGAVHVCSFEEIDQPTPRKLARLFSIYLLPVGKKIVETYSILCLYRGFKTTPASGGTVIRA